MPEARTILVCTANPSEMARLRAAEEVRSLEAELEKVKQHWQKSIEAIKPPETPTPNPPTP